MPSILQSSPSSNAIQIQPSNQPSEPNPPFSREFRVELARHSTLPRLFTFLQSSDRLHHLQTSSDPLAAKTTQLLEKYNNTQNLLLYASERWGALPDADEKPIVENAGTVGWTVLSLTVKGSENALVDLNKKCD